MKIKINLLLGQNLDNCQMLNLNFIENKVIGSVSFTNTGCYIKVYGDNSLEYKINFDKIIESGLYVVFGNTINIKPNQYGECSITDKTLLNKAINYVKENNMQYKQNKDDILDKLDDFKTGRKI